MASCVLVDGKYWFNTMKHCWKVYQMEVQRAFLECRNKAPSNNNELHEIVNHAFNLCEANPMCAANATFNPCATNSTYIALYIKLDWSDCVSSIETESFGKYNVICYRKKAGGKNEYHNDQEMW